MFDNALRDLDYKVLCRHKILKMSELLAFTHAPNGKNKQKKTKYKLAIHCTPTTHEELSRKIPNGKFN